MGLVYKSCVSLQRKSFLIDQKYLDIKALSKEGIGNPIVSIVVIIVVKLVFGFY